MMTAGPLSDAGGYRHSFADLNSDGTPDLVMADRCSLLVWFGKLDGAALIPGQKTGHVFEPSIVEISGLDATNQPQLVDMNGDGLVDVVASNDTWRVWYNKGLTQRSSPDAPPDRPVFSDPVQLPVMGGFVTGYYPCHRFLMQLDGDPSMDLVSYCPDSETDFNNLFFYRGSPDGFFPLRKLENVPGLALPVKITSTGDSALTFVAKAPTPRNKDDSCPKETAGGRDSGANGPRYWCSPLVQWMSLRDANSDLLTKVSNFRGVTVKYEYRWDPLRPGFGGARSVVDNRTVSITGQTPISTRYSFEDPWLDDAGDFGGYGYIRAEERDVTSPRFSRTRSVKYDHEHGLSWPVERHVESHDGHKRSWFTPHDVITYAGVPLLRPVAIRLEAAIGSVVAPGEGRLLTSTEFEYGRETPFDPQTVITKQLGGRAFTRIQKIGYVRPAGLHGTLAWLPWRVATRGSHPGDGTLNYDQNDQSTYSGTGLLESQSRVSRDERLLLIKRKYSPRGLIEEETRLGAGTVRYQYAKVREGSDVDTALLEHVDLPQGRHQDFEYWPVTDLPKSYTRSEGGTPHRINWEFDPYGNPLVEYDTQFGPGPSRTFTHREASTDRLGYDVVVTRFAGKERWEMTLFDGNREPLATASVRSDRKPGISDTPWTIEEARVHDKASGSWVRFRGGVMDLGWPSAPTLTQLLNAKGKVILQQGTQRPSSRSSEWTEYTAPNAMRERWRSIPTLNTDGTLTVTARSTSGRVRLETYDGADRVVKTVSPGGLRVETVYDAEGRARRFRLPGNSETSTYDASIDYDALGRVTDTERDGVRTIYTYRPGHQRPKCIDSKPVTFGESRTECYDWSAFGEIIQRRAFIDGMLEDTVSWSYPPNSVQPQYIQGKGFRKAFSYDQSGRNTSVTIELFPEPGDQTPWRTIRFESKPLVSGVTESQGIFVSRGPIVEKSYEYRATYDRHGFPSGIWGSPWGGVDITKQRLETVTKYLAGGASLREVTHLDGLRRPDVISAFDKSGQTMRIAREGGGGADTASEVVQFGGVEEKAGFSFNADGQLVTAFRMRPGADTYYQVYSYDERGLLSTKAEGQGLQLTTTPVVRTNGNIVLGSRHWKLDHFGRVVETPTATFTWNATNQVKSVRKDGRKYDYVYDEVGQRLFRTTVAGDGTRSTVAWIDGMRIADGEPVRFPVEVDGQLLGLWESGSEGMVRVGQDGIGTLRLFDGAKVSLDDRFGTKSTYLMKVPEFAGGFFDEVLGMVRLGVRDYIPDLAQFSSKDPLFEAHPELCRSNPVSCNLYTYARSNPIDRWDPTGLRDISGYCDVSNQSCPESVGLDAHPTVLEQLASRSMTTRDVSDPEEALKHTGSFSLGYSGLIALGFALSLEFSHIFLNGEERLGLTWGWGGGGVGASLGPSVGWSNARSFDQMAGDGYLVSPRGIVAFGASRFGGNGYDGTSVGLGVGWGIPMGGLQTYTWLVPVPRAASAGSVRGHMLGGGL